METLNLDLLPDEAKKEVIQHYQKLLDKYSKKKKNFKLPEGFYNPIDIQSYDLIASREDIYER